MYPTVHQKVSHYRGRIAPSPTGYLHAGHASTFKIAHDRAKANNGILILRNEDLDPDRCKTEYAVAIIEDLKLMGIEWQEGPINQSDRIPLYLNIWEQLKNTHHIYPCTLSRKQLDEQDRPYLSSPPSLGNSFAHLNSPGNTNWRFRVPDNQIITFTDANYGPQAFTCSQDFGDFIVWRRDGVPSYELAVVVDDYDMGITEVVRGADLLMSTARQLLLYQALHWRPPAFYHCPLIYDENGQPLSKRNRSKSIIQRPHYEHPSND